MIIFNTILFILVIFLMFFSLCIMLVSNYKWKRLKENDKKKN